MTRAFFQTTPPTAHASDGDRRSPPPTHRLFYACFLDEAAIGAASGISRTHDLDRRLGGTRLPPNRYHVTLEHVGDYFDRPLHVIDFALRVGDAVSAWPFLATFTYAESFRGRPGRHPYVLRGDEGIAGFHHLRMAIGGACLKEGLDVRNTRYKVHVTLQYGKRAAPPLKIPQLSWPVDKFALVLSHLGQTRYEILREWNLAEKPLEEAG